jgi:uncharacterized protein (TIGR02001 family)
MKLNKLALACGVAMLGLSSLAAADVSMNIGATSNYVWRGVTQTGDASAISGGVDWSHDSGVYLGAWASNVDFSTHELDLYGGYAGEVGDFGYDGGLIYYTYDSNDDLNFSELSLSGSWQFLSAGLNYTLSADDDTHKHDLYYHAGVSFDLQQDYSIAGTVGKYNFDDPAYDDYTHYQVDLTKSAGDFGDVTFSLSDTNIKDDNAKVFVSWAKSF